MYTTLIPDVENSVITCEYYSIPSSINGAGDLAVMGVLSPGFILDSVRAKLIETTEDVGSEFGVHERERVKETVGDTAVWTQYFQMEQSNLL